MIGFVLLTVILRQLLDDGGVPPVAPVTARVRQAFAPVLLVTQEFDVTVETRQVIEPVLLVTQEFEAPQ